MTRSTKQNYHRGAEKQRNSAESGFLPSVPLCLCGYIYLGVFRAFRGSISLLMLLVLFAAFFAAAPALAQAPEEQSAIARKQKVAALLSSAQGPATDRAPRIAKASGGYVRHVGFPRGRGIEAPGADPQNPRDVTEKFLNQWRDAFVNPSAKVHFETIGVNAHRGRSYIRVQQKYGGLKIFDAEMNVQVGADGRIASVLCNVMPDTGVLDRGELSTSPTLTPQAAQRAAIQFFSDIASSATLAAFTASTPELLLFHPPVMDQKGPTRLVWSAVVRHSGEPLVAEQVLVDAQTGEIPLRFSLILNGKYREIYDQDGDPYYSLRTLIRDDGQHQGESGIPEVNRAFDLFGYIYDLYWDWHGRDSYDDVGQHIRVGVRMGIEWESAVWEGGNQNIFIGTLLFDDVSMHEYTHGVSQHLGLGWTGETLALHESFSDMWGDWFDQENNFINLYGYTNLDGGDYDWLNAEDRGDEKGAYRSMKDPPTDTMIDPPPLQHSPDRYKGPNWEDNNDPHYNCGVGNKLCYLLSDSNPPTYTHTFNGFTISSTVSRSAAAELFYEARLHLSGSVGYHDLYSKLMDAAETLGYSDAQKLNLEKACQAVNIRTSNVGLTLKNTSGDTRGFLQDAGQLLLKKTLTPQAQSPIDTSNGGLIIRDTSGTVVAFINASAGENGGEMKILGGLTDANDDLPPESSDNLLIVRYEGVIVTAIDKYGNLKIWGEVEQNHSF